MKKDIKKKWVKALRSGKYRQATETLKNHSGAYCCLGVLCSVSKVKNWVGENELTDYLMERFGLNPNEQQRLIRMNDSEEKSFKEIASFIEAHL